MPCFPAAVDGIVKDEDLPGCARRRQGSREPFHLALLLQVIRVEDEDIDGPDTSFVPTIWHVEEVHDGTTVGGGFDVVVAE